MTSKGSSWRQHFVNTSKQVTTPKRSSKSQKQVITSKYVKVRHDVKMFVMMSQTRHDAKKFIMASKTRLMRLKTRLNVKQFVMTWCQEHVITLKVQQKRFVMTSKTRHDAKKFVMTSTNTSWRQQVRQNVRHDVKNTSWQQKVHKYLQFYVMTPKIRHDNKRYVMTQKVCMFRPIINVKYDLSPICFKNILTFYDVWFPSYQRLCFSQFQWPWPCSFYLFQWYFSTIQVSYSVTSISSFVTIGGHITKS